MTAARLGFAIAVGSLCWGTIACTPSLPTGRWPARAAVPGPAPTQKTLLDLATAADTVRVMALASADPAGLANVFGGAALQLLVLEVGHLRLRREQVDIEVARRELVHWSTRPGAGTVVLEVTGHQRLVASGQGHPWDVSVEQLAFTVQWDPGWLVTALEDLPPAVWWPA